MPISRDLSQEAELIVLLLLVISLTWNEGTEIKRRQTQLLKMMATCIQGRFKICFMFLLFAVFIGLSCLHISNVSFKPSKAWVSGFTRHLHSMYMPSSVQNMGNQTPSLWLPYLHYKAAAGKQIPNTTHVEVRRLNVTVSTDQNPAVTEAPMTQRYNEAYPRNYRFILDEPDICEQQKPFLVLMVPVAPQQLEARDAIRSTWGNESVVQGKNITVLFMLGLRGDTEEAKEQERLSSESLRHHDLIQSNFKDTYKNLTTKTMVIMDWLATRCPQAAYAMKIDSDMFLNLENLMNMLLAPDTPKENYMTGMVMYNRPVVRNQNSKWYVPKELYAEDVYPTYLLGMGYVFSNDLPEKLVKISEDIQPFNIEDAYVGACLKKLGISPANPPNPSQFKAYHSGEYKHSEFAKVITTILSSPKQLVTFWQELKRST